MATTAPDAGGTTRPPDLERVERRDHVRGAAVSIVVIAAWVVLAVWTPTSTYHVAPLIAAGAWAFLLRRGPLRVAAIDAGRSAVAGGVLVVVVGVGLHLAELLRGPTLWGSGPAIAEVPLAALAGAVLGFRYARCGVPASDQ